MAHRSTRLLLWGCLCFQAYAAPSSGTDSSAPARFAAWVSESERSVHHGMMSPETQALVTARNIHLQALVDAGNYSEVLAAARAVPLAVRAELPPVLLASMADSLLAASIDVDTRICAPRIGSHSMHVEYEASIAVPEAGAARLLDATVSGAAAAGGSFMMRVPGRAWKDASSFFATPTNDPVGVHGPASAWSRFGASADGVPVLGVLWNPLAVEGSGLSAAPILIAAEDIYHCDDDAIDGGVQCVVGSQTRSFPSRAHAHAAGMAQFRRSAAERMTRLGLRPAGHWREQAVARDAASGLSSGRVLASSLSAEEGGTGMEGPAGVSVDDATACTTSLHQPLTPAAAVAAAGAAGRRLNLPLSYTVGNRTMLAAVLAFADSPSNAITIPNANTIMNAVLANFQRMAFGAMAMNLTLPQQSFIMALNASAEPSAGAVNTAAQAALTAAGYNVNGYRHWVMLLPWMGWMGWGGLGSVLGTTTWLTDEGNWYDIQVINHEVGHNFGLLHASTRDAFTAAWSEYGDNADIMGGGNPAAGTGGDYQAGYKSDLNWIPPQYALSLNLPPATASVLGATSGPAFAPPSAPATAAAVAAAGNAALPPWAGSSTTLSLAGEDIGAIPSASGGFLTLRTPSPYTSITGVSWWTYASLRSRFATYYTPAHGYVAQTGFTLQQVPFSSTCGNSLLVDPAPQTATQYDAAVPPSVGATLYDPSPLGGTRLLLENLAASSALNAQGYVATALTVRASFLGPGLERPEGLGCSGVDGSCEAPVAAVPFVCPSGPGLDGSPTLLSVRILSPLVPIAVYAVSMPADGLARAVNVTTCLPWPGSANAVDTRLALWTEFFPGAEALTYAPFTNGASAGLGAIGSVPGSQPPVSCSSLQFTLWPGSGAYVAVTTWPRGLPSAPVPLSITCTPSANGSHATIAPTSLLTNEGPTQVCPAASWRNATTGQCVGCQPLSLAPEGASDPSQCGCAVGYFGAAAAAGAAPNAPAYTCLPCAAGSAKAFRTSDPTLCQACPSGSSAAAGSTRCVPSAAGSACPVGFYGQNPSCAACPPGSTTPGSSTTFTTPASCACLPGWMLNASTGACAACPADTYSPASGASSCASCPGAPPGSSSCACPRPNFVPSGIYCGCPWGYTTFTASSTGAPLCVPPTSLLVASPDGTLPAWLTGYYTLSPVVAARAAAAAAAAPGNASAAAAAAGAAAADAASGCSAAAKPYSGRSWALSTSVGASATTTYVTLWFDASWGEWSLSPGLVPASGGPRFAYIPAALGVYAGAYPPGLTPDATGVATYRYAGNASGSVLPLGAGQTWKVYTGFVPRFVAAPSLTGSLLVSVASAADNCSAGGAAALSPLPTPSAYPTATPTATPVLSAAHLNGALWSNFSLVAGGGWLSGVASLTLSVGGSQCLNFMELFVFSPTAQHVLFPSAFAPAAAITMSSVRGGNGLLYGARNAVDLVCDPYGGDTITSPLVHGGCMPVDTWAATLPAPANVSAIYLINRRDSITECNGDCGARIVNGGASLTLANAAGAPLWVGYFPFLQTVYNFTFGVPSAPLFPTASDSIVQSSPSALRWGVRRINLTCAVGSFLHFREIFVLDEFGVNVARGKNGTGTPCYTGDPPPAYTALAPTNGIIQEDATYGDLFHSLQSVVFGDAWWSIDLGGVYNVTNVIIFNRAGSLASRMSGAMLSAVNGNGETVANITLGSGTVQSIPLVPQPPSYTPTSTASATLSTSPTVSLSIGLSPSVTPVSVTASPSPTQSATQSATNSVYAEPYFLSYLVGTTQTLSANYLYTWWPFAAGSQGSVSMGSFVPNDPLAVVSDGTCASGYRWEMQRFVGGAVCSGVGPRSANVTLSCGVSTALTSASEPWTCSYLLTATVVCTGNPAGAGTLCTAPSASPTPTPSPSTGYTAPRSPSATGSPTGTPTGTGSITGTPTQSSSTTTSWTGSATSSGTRSATPTGTASRTEAPTSSQSITSTPTDSVTATTSATGSATQTPSSSGTGTPTISSSGTVTGTPLSTSSNTRTSAATHTSSVSASSTPSNTISPTITRTPHVTPTNTRSQTGSRSATSTSSPSSSASGSASSSSSPTATPSSSYTPARSTSATRSSARTTSPAPTPAITSSASPSVTVSGTLSGSAAPSPSRVSVSGTPSRTVSISHSQTRSSTGTRTASHSGSRTRTSTRTPKASPTSSRKGKGA